MYYIFLKLKNTSKIFKKNSTTNTPIFLHFLLAMFCGNNCFYQELLLLKLLNTCSYYKYITLAHANQILSVLRI